MPHFPYVSVCRSKNQKEDGEGMDGRDTKEVGNRVMGYMLVTFLVV